VRRLPAGAGADASVVRLSAVTKTYPGGVTALRDISLEIGYGEALAVVGPSGSGKSTLLHLVGALDQPSSGTVHIDGHDLSQLSDREASVLRGRRIGFVFQQFHLAANTSAVENVADGLLYTGAPQRERRRRATEVLDLVGLGGRLTHRVHQLSGGERQRVARAVVREPALLLADEPTGNLDSASGAAVLEILAELRSRGTTLVLVTHDQQIAARMPRQISMRDGEIVDA
jgi:putative ABC transport system ATP-binding protein